MAASLRVLKTIIRPRISETVIKYNILNANKLWTNNLITNSRQLSYSYRTHLCGDLRESNVGETITVSGWIQSTRMNRFLLLRDISGMCQVVMTDNCDHQLIHLPNESVVTITGTIRRRPAGQENLRMSTGHVELELDKVVEISPAKPDLPFQQNDHLLPKEDLRMEYRYLDLRRRKLQEKLRFRSDLVMSLREFLVKENFLDIETPTLFRRTPGGAKEFIVPSRIKDKFYSLVQSPQQFKQLLMVGGLDRYFQIARCYRDEGGKPDRQPEFTQVDIEMSFAGREDVISMMEDLLSNIWPGEKDGVLRVGEGNLVTPFQRITYQEAMDNYGVDKPDLRFENKINFVTDIFQTSNFDILDKHIGNNNNMAAYVVFDTDNQNKKKLIKDIEAESKMNLKHHLESFPSADLKIISPLIVEKGEVGNSVLKKCSAEVVAKLSSKIGLESGAGFLVFGPKDFVLPVLGKLRSLLGRELIPDLTVRPNELVWVLDFPLFVREEGRLESAHHPFTAPHPQDRHQFRSQPEDCRSLHYDLVLNGQEIGGGSVRIHSGEEQRFVLETVLAENTDQLNHLLQALDSGCPPHAGIALGLDRLVAILTHADSIRDVIAFPKSGDGRDLMAGAPADISPEQRTLYHLD